ncbi:MAG: hypothetical protein ACOYEK_00390 [bacterium]|jgi:hypothetical protein
MIALDLIGLVLSWLFLGPRYPGYIILLSIFQETSRFLLALALKTGVLNLTIGGIFGVTTIHQDMGSFPFLLILYSGPFCCYLLSRYRGCMQREEGAILFHPLAVLANPVGVLAWRFSLFSALVSTWRLLTWA